MCNCSLLVILLNLAQSNFHCCNLNWFRLFFKRLYNKVKKISVILCSQCISVFIFESYFCSDIIFDSLLRDIGRNDKKFKSGNKRHFLFICFSYFIV